MAFQSRMASLASLAPELRITNAWLYPIAYMLTTMTIVHGHGAATAESSLSSSPLLLNGNTPSRRNSPPLRYSRPTPSVWIGLVRLLTVASVTTTLATQAATVLFDFSNVRQVGEIPRVVNAAPIYGPDPVDARLSLHGQSAEGVPTGTTVYAGPKLEGSNYRAELLFGATPEELAVVPDSQTRFRSGSTAGFWIGKRVGLPAIPAGVPYYLKVRIWDDQGGTIDSWDKVLADPSVLRGESLLLTTYNSGIGPDGQLYLPDLTLWKSFNLHTDSSGQNPPRIELTRPTGGQQLTLTWTGKLEAAETPNGPWSVVPDVISPLTVEPSGPERYYRARLP